MLRRKARQRGPNPYSAIRFHQGYVYEPVRHTVLTASQLPPDKVEMIAAVLKTVTNGPQALTLPDGHSGWSTTEIGHLGKIYLVAYCGIEVALFFKRQLTEIIPEPGEKIPEGVLQDPLEAWQRLDLMGRSAEKSNYVLTSSQRRLEEMNKLLTENNKELEELNDQLEERLSKEAREVARLLDERGALEKKLKLLKKPMGQWYKSKPTSKQKTSLKTKGKRGKHGLSAHDRALMRDANIRNFPYKQKKTKRRK